MRVRSLDSLRFIAAAGVALFHFDINLKLGLTKYIHAVANFGVFVDFFFVLSGFVIALNYSGKIGSFVSYGQFLQKRLARIYPLHFVVLIVFLSLGFAAARFRIPIHHADFFKLDALPANLLLVQAWGFTTHPSFNPASWSISAEFFVYLLFPILALLVDRFHPLSSLAAIIAFAAAMEFVRQRVDLPPWTTATYDFGMCRAIPTFWLGVLLARCSPVLASRISPSWPFAYALLGATLIAMQFNVADELTILIFSVLIIACVAAEAHGNNGILLSRPFVILGDASYSIYMVHGLVLIPTVFVVMKLFGLGTLAAGACAFMGLAATFAFSILVYRYFEDPTRRFLGALPLFSGHPARYRPKFQKMQTTLRFHTLLNESILGGAPPP